jgi:hypothetical protein
MFASLLHVVASQAALEKRLADELAAPAVPGELSTEMVEEYISIADGQVCGVCVCGGGE